MQLDMKLKGSDLFDALGRERDEESEIFKVNKNPRLEEICRRFERWLEKSFSRNQTAKESYQHALEIIFLPYVEISSEDINLFSILLKKYESSIYFNFTESGIFLSALIEGSKDKEFQLTVCHYQDAINYLGFANTKKLTIHGTVEYELGAYMRGGRIIVNGNAGNYAGYLMENGKIEIHGDAKDNVGANMKNGRVSVNGSVKKYLGRDMEGGEIVVNGNAGSEVGSGMNNGRIIVYGNVEDFVGLNMWSGEIRVYGQIGSIADTSYNIKGNIYHKDKLIVRNGRRIG